MFGSFRTYLIAPYPFSPRQVSIKIFIFLSNMLGVASMMSMQAPVGIMKLKRHHVDYDIAATQLQWPVGLTVL